MPEIAGRDEELDALRGFLAGAGRGAAGLVLEGEPGIGKSTLWQAGIEQASAAGLRVVVSRPAEAERGLVHAGLGDLLDGTLEDVLPALPPPRRLALEVALLRRAGDPLDPRALAVAVRDALQFLAEREPLVIAIDDVQWLDASSSSALAFACAGFPEPAWSCSSPGAWPVGSKARRSSRRSPSTASSGYPSGP